MSLNSRLKAIQIVGQRKAFYTQRIPESRYARKEIVDIDILVTSRNGEKKNHAIYQNNEYDEEGEPVETVQTNIYQSNT